MSSETDCLVYIGGINKIEVIDRTKVARIVNDLPLSDKFASVSLNPGGTFETLKFIEETAVFKVVSEVIEAGTIHKVEILADFSGMETFEKLHKLLFGEWIVRLTDAKDVQWLFGMVSKAGRFKRALDSQKSGATNSISALTYNFSSTIPPLKSV